MALKFDLELPRRDFVLKLEGELDGGITGVFGPSGAGKSSFFQLLYGLETPTKGKIVLNGKTLVNTENKQIIPIHKRRIGVVFQDKRLFPHMTVRENLLFGQKYIQKSPLNLTDTVDLLDLGTLLDSYPYEISGGEQQRTAIGRALLMAPELLLLDEPFNAVDNSRREAMLPYLKRLRNRLEIPMLVISHDLPDLQRLTSSIYLIEEGRCTGFGNINNLMNEGRRILFRSGQVNTFPIEECEITSPSLYRCTVKGYPSGVLNVPFPVKEGTVLTLPPHEVALSRTAIEKISMQNQIPGTITNMVSLEERLFCRIEGNLSFTAEITPHSAEELELQIGSKVYGLFKAHSLGA
jgi:molybdate transport system ATP-binding protein